MSKPRDQGKGSERRPGKPGAYEEGWERIFGDKKSQRILKDGEPCDHPGCVSHVTHPCEGCGRIAAGSVREVLPIDYSDQEGREFDQCLRAMMGAIHLTDENRRSDTTP